MGNEIFGDINLKFNIKIYFYMRGLPPPLPSAFSSNENETFKIVIKLKEIGQKFSIE